MFWLKCRNLFYQVISTAIQTQIQQNNVIYYLTTVNVLCTSILRCVRVVISKHNFFFCGSQHVQLTSPVYNNNHGKLDFMVACDGSRFRVCGLVYKLTRV